MLTTITLSVLLVLLTSAVLLATLVGVVTGLLSKMGGMTGTSAILRGGVAFGGTLTLLLAVMTFVSTLAG
ncbi:hypothetical protein ACFOWE_17500 [Planomonospora corallina]|uniref:Uncharacterized protein n=2 Tax=Planomonospora corallina TaxID=1806052 RepID=A0ABV8IC71_9ACTN